MRTGKHRSVWVNRFLALLCLLAGPAMAQDGPHVRGELIPAVSMVAPGDKFDVLFRQEIDDDWHTYWLNPGDSGAAPDITWTAPDGVIVSSFRYPYPERIPYGPLMNFGYHHEVMLPFSVQVPGNFSDDVLAIEGKGRVLVCADICIPENVTLSLRLPVGETRLIEERQSLFAAANARIPVPLDVPVQTRETGDDALTLTIALPGGDRVTAVDYFPLVPDLIDNAAEQSWQFTAEGLVLNLTRGFAYESGTADLSGVLVISEDVGDGLVASYEFRTGNSATPTTEGEGLADPGISLLGAMLFAFLGGLILNLMPCVFPVLSIKVLSLTESAAGNPAVTRMHGLAYAAGVVGSFVAIALLLMLLRAGGEAIGWGFQLQSPVVVAMLAYLFIVIGLNLLGVFEVGLTLMSVGSGQAGSGYLGSVSTGILATVVAAPCTAPFMGAAVGYALVQSPLVAILVFASLGAGMAVPYVALTFSPALLARLPRPGDWMVTLKQFLAFPMFASAIWLLWVLGIQSGVDAMMQVLGGGLLIAFAIWLVSVTKGNVVKVLGVTLVALSLYVAASQTPQAVPGSAGSGGSAEIQNTAGVYSEQALAAAVAEGPVFVNFTAAWCITCKVNELNALNAGAVVDAFTDAGVTYLKADWTNEDPLITEALQAYGRSGVPLYLLYEKGASRAEVLPQILTPQIVIDAVQDLGSGEKP